MAAELINLRRIVGDDNVVSSAQKPYEEELNNLLTLAKSRGFSNQGEMYSAENLAHLAEEFYGVKCSVISNAFEDQHSTVSQLLKGSAVLVPYDADKNNKPCLENGLSRKLIFSCILHSTLGLISKTFFKPLIHFHLDQQCITFRRNTLNIVLV